MKEKIINFFKQYYICIIIIVLGFLFDFLTKKIATNNLTYYIGSNKQVISAERNVVIDGFFYFSYARNTGGGWSIFSGKMWILISATLIALGIFFYLLKNFDIKKRPLYSIGLSLMVAGTFGNFFDRIVYGYVTDFFDFIIFGYDYPIFNIADTLLVIGVILLIIQIIFFYKQVKFLFETKGKQEIKEEENNEQ